MKCRVLAGPPAAIKVHMLYDFCCFFYHKILNLGSITLQAEQLKTVNISSTRSPGVNQVDDLPPAFNRE